MLGVILSTFSRGYLLVIAPSLICSEVNKLLKGISLLKSQQRNSALNHIRVSQILYKYVLRRINNQQIRLSVAEIINTAKTP
ncbi:enterotoxin A family protein [Leuconostoc mesenteroides]|uniref:enterotoxin A family protein n=1 Tax=Leuconostoc mesenteroides TaxID=1245 RepID=UPI002889D21D|nr:enterotoxin A family protein [Leuconostoc mesenteroides]